VFEGGKQATMEELIKALPAFANAARLRRDQDLARKTADFSGFDAYMLLANTYNDLVGQIVTFTPQEIDELRVLLRKATLDIEFRKQLAHVLDAAVQVSKLLLRVAGKLVA
jgi:hypothetical protein